MSFVRRWCAREFAGWSAARMPALCCCRCVCCLFITAEFITKLCTGRGRLSDVRADARVPAAGARRSRLGNFCAVSGRHRSARAESPGNELKRKSAKAAQQRRCPF